MRAREKGLRLNDVAAEHETTMMEREFPLIFSKPRIGAGVEQQVTERAPIPLRQWANSI